ncbi:unnamed protein product [Phytophthora fragariaefolia]|uniref:Unnamed protein product n=1 Tax=Phytophthora fragariaefolia TaxID=1490495 RepID=A0A9W6Y8P6_9STRA|nr:unnamed protein product [Phytophthora fragariaefolia]
MDGTFDDQRAPTVLGSGWILQAFYPSVCCLGASVEPAHDGGCGLGVVGCSTSGIQRHQACTTACPSAAAA